MRTKFIFFISGNQIIPAFVPFHTFQVLKMVQYPLQEKLFSKQDCEHLECQYSFLHKLCKIIQQIIFLRLTKIIRNIPPPINISRSHQAGHGQLFSSNPATKATWFQECTVSISFFFISMYGIHFKIISIG